MSLRVSVSEINLSLVRFSVSRLDSESLHFFFNFYTVVVLKIWNVILQNKFIFILKFLPAIRENALQDEEVKVRAASVGFDSW